MKKNLFLFALVVVFNSCGKDEEIQQSQSIQRQNNTAFSNLYDAMIASNSYVKFDSISEILYKKSSNLSYPEVTTSEELRRYLSLTAVRTDIRIV